MLQIEIAFAREQQPRRDTGNWVGTLHAGFVSRLFLRVPAWWRPPEVKFIVSDGSLVRGTPNVFRPCSDRAGAFTQDRDGAGVLTVVGVRRAGGARYLLLCH